VAGYPGGVFQHSKSLGFRCWFQQWSELTLNNPSALSIYTDAQILNALPPRRGGNSAAAGELPDKQLNPNREATRAEVAAFVYKHSSMPDARKPFSPLW